MIAPENSSLASAAKIISVIHPGEGSIEIFVQCCDLNPDAQQVLDFVRRIPQRPGEHKPFLAPARMPRRKKSFPPSSFAPSVKRRHALR